MVVRFDLHILLHGTLLAAWAASPRLVSSRLGSHCCCPCCQTWGAWHASKPKPPNKPWGVCERYLACSSMQEPDASPLPGWAWEGGIWQTAETACSLATLFLFLEGG
jgi:hypothetical protein